MERYIQKKLEHLPLHERKQAFTLLCAIGLEHVDQQRQQQQQRLLRAHRNGDTGCDDRGNEEEEHHPVSVIALNRYCDRLFRDRLIKREGDERQHKAVEEPLVRKPPVPTQSKSVTPMYNHNVEKQIRCYHDANHIERHSRSDTVGSFPFVDDRGSVDQVLHLRPALGCSGETAVDGTKTGTSRKLTDECADESGVTTDLCKTSLPGRMRLITRTYREICSSGGKAGMKHADIPIALRALGLRVSPRLEQLLAAGGCGIHTASIPNRGATTATGSMVPLAPTTITLTQFQDIVNKCLELEHKHRNAGNADPMAVSTTTDVCGSTVANLVDRRNSNSCLLGGLGQIGDNFAAEDEDIIDTILFNDIGGDGDVGGRMGCKGPRDGPSKIKVRHTTTSAQRRAMHSQSHSHGHASSGDSLSTGGKLQQSSSFRDQIRQDRRHFEQRRRAEEVAAERTIAEYKVDQYLDTHDNSSYFDWRKAGSTSGVCAGAGEEDDVIVSGYVRAGQKTTQQYKPAGKAKHSSISIGNAPYSLTRNSGDAAVIIADAFLNGPVARDILRPATTATATLHAPGSGGVWDQNEEEVTANPRNSLNIRAFEKAYGDSAGNEDGEWEKEEAGGDSGGLLDLDSSDLGENLSNVLKAPTGLGSWSNERYLARQQAQAEVQAAMRGLQGQGQGQENISGLRSQAFDHSAFFLQSQHQRSAAANALVADRPELGFPRNSAAAAAATQQPMPNLPPPQANFSSSSGVDAGITSANDRVSVLERMRRQNDEDAFNHILHGTSAGSIERTKRSSGSGSGSGITAYADPLDPGYARSSGSKWKGTRGGWVADFGPLHTRSLAPEVDPASDPGRSRASAAAAATASGVDSEMFTEARRRENKAALKRLSESKCLSCEHGGIGGVGVGLGAGGSKSKNKNTKEKEEGREDVEEVLMDFVSHHQPVRPYSEISETYIKTGVKPWQQMALLKKYYGKENAAFQNNSNTVLSDEPEEESEGGQRNYFGTKRGGDYKTGKQKQKQKQKQGHEHEHVATVPAHMNAGKNADVGARVRQPQMLKEKEQLQEQERREREQEMPHGRVAKWKDGSMSAVEREKERERHIAVARMQEKEREKEWTRQELDERDRARVRELEKEKRVRLLRARQAQADAEEEERERERSHANAESSAPEVVGDAEPDEGPEVDEDSSASTVAVHDLRNTSSSSSSRAIAEGGLVEGVDVDVSSSINSSDEEADEADATDSDAADAMEEETLGQVLSVNVHHYAVAKRVGTNGSSVPELEPEDDGSSTMTGAASTETSTVPETARITSASPQQELELEQELEQEQGGQDQDHHEVEEEKEEKEEKGPHGQGLVVITSEETKQAKKSQKSQKSEGRVSSSSSSSKVSFRNDLPGTSSSTGTGSALKYWDAKAVWERAESIQAVLRQVGDGDNDSDSEPGEGSSSSSSSSGDSSSENSSMGSPLYMSSPKLPIRLDVSSRASESVSTSGRTSASTSGRASTSTSVRSVSASEFRAIA